MTLDKETPDSDGWRDAGIALSRVGSAYAVIVAFICGLLTCALGVWLVAKWLLP